MVYKNTHQNGEKTPRRGNPKNLGQLLLARRHTPRRRLQLHQLLQIMKAKKLFGMRRYVLCKRGHGNSVYMSAECLNKGSMNVDAICKSKALMCGHTHTKVALDKIGTFVTINWFTVHSSGYPFKVDAKVVQFFFTSSSARPKRQISHGAAFLEGKFDPALASSVGRRVVRDWPQLLSTHRRKGRYQGVPLKDVVEYSTSFIRSDLSREFRELHELKCAAEDEFSRLHGLEVVTHTIWIIEKKACADAQEGGSGGFEPHVDHFSADRRHIGTISTPVAFVRVLG
jgi:hypothetical protein